VSVSCTLWWAHNRVDDEFVERLATSEAATTIEELDLSRTSITDATLQRLLPAFPHLRCALAAPL
jgi:hypothetical protein